MKTNNVIFTFLIMSVLVGCATKANRVVNANEQSISTNKHTALKDAFEGKFYIGAAVSTRQMRGQNATAVELVKQHFNSIVSENSMKTRNIQPREGQFNFDDADRFVEFGEENNMQLIGHTLVWHSQSPKWFFVDENGDDVSREVLIERMRNHITTVVSRYKGRIKGWDVVNEGVLDNGDLRKSKFYEIIGKDYIKMAFEFAYAADPDAELYYNDYSTARESKRNGIVKLVKELQQEGVKVSGIGMQEHHQLGYPAVSEVEKSIIAFSDLGVKVMVTEMDISVLPFPREDIGAEVSANFEYQEKMNPYKDGLPLDIKEKFNDRYMDFFKIYLKHHDKISRVTVWGVGDSDSWLNNWPIWGRTDYPLLFDREYKAKPIVENLLKMDVK